MGTYLVHLPPLVTAGHSLVIIGQVIAVFRDAHAGHNTVLANSQARSERSLGTGARGNRKREHNGSDSAHDEWWFWLLDWVVG